MYFYTGSPIDILFGLLILYNKFKYNDFNLILDYPLTINTDVEKYYKKLGINYIYKLDFSNIEILWSYQHIFYPTFFDNEIKNKMNKSKYIAIPIGIEISTGAHANILFWDVVNKTIERFEPNGANYPINFNYNPKLLDTLLENKFKEYDKDIKYYRPIDFLPIVGFQMLEILETDKFRKLNDPNGFCAVWCIWWVYQRIINIDENISNIDFANKLIEYIKLDNLNFKTIIRNFSSIITILRDEYLSKHNLDINMWLTENYTSSVLNDLEKEIITNF